MVPRRPALAALFAVLAIPAFALDYRLGAIEIGQPWARATPPTAESGGGFLVITNPGATVELKPGGFHVMFMGLKAPFAKDAKVPLTLVFEKAGSIDVDLMVQAMGAQAPIRK